MLKMLSESAEKNIKWREQNPDIKILDLSYEEINRNSINVLRSVYQFLGLELTPEIEESAIGWEKNKKKNRFSRNSYAPEEFGLTERQIRDAFEPYIERFSGYIR
jgi:hypothetical protein